MIVEYHLKIFNEIKINTETIPLIQLCELFVILCLFILNDLSHGYLLRWLVINKTIIKLFVISSLVMVASLFIESYKIILDYLIIILYSKIFYKVNERKKISVLVIIVGLLLRKYFFIK